MGSTCNSVSMKDVRRIVTSAQRCFTNYCLICVFHLLCHFVTSLKFCLFFVVRFSLGQVRGRDWTNMFSCPSKAMSSRRITTCILLSFFFFSAHTSLSHTCGMQRICVGSGNMCACGLCVVCVCVCVHVLLLNAMFGDRDRNDIETKGKFPNSPGRSM